VRVLEGLRRRGYGGEIVLLGAEAHAPYDRPPLSKSVLAGRSPFWLVPPDRLAELGVRARLGVAAAALEPGGRTVVLADGERVRGDAVVVATGASARPLRVPGGESALLLRTLDDALALRAALVPGTRLVVVGAGFLGCEIAATASALGVHVTVLEPLATPLARALPPVLGARIAALHAERGVDLRCASPPVTAVEPGRVRLPDGGALAADTVVVAIGAEPGTAWLAGSGVLVDDGVVSDAQGRTSVPGVWAAGDVARWHSPRYGRQLRVEHWTSADGQGDAVAAALLGEPPGLPDLPYVWSDQHGLKLQVLGLPDPADRVHVLPDPQRPQRFLALCARDDTVTGVVALGQPARLAALRGALLAGTGAQQLLADLDAAQGAGSPACRTSA